MRTLAVNRPYILVPVGRSADIGEQVSRGLSEALSLRDGRVVPEAKDIGPSEGVELDAAYVYADMAGSSDLAHSVYKPVAAKVIRAYVNTATQILNYWGGEVRSFDGDRVMAIFIGEDRNRVATRAALEINWAVNKVIRPAIEAMWSDTAAWKWRLDHGVGVDTGRALLVRAGVRSDNDIVSVGRAPNVAAKLSSLRDSGPLYITRAIYDDLNDLLLSQRGESMWRQRYGVERVGGVGYSVYTSNWYWGPNT